jgi:hypothetical protein
MAITISLILFVLGVFASALSRQLTDDFKEWTPWLLAWLVQQAVRRLPEEQQERYSQEWPGHLNEVPGQIGKFVVAAGFIWAAQKERSRASTAPNAAKYPFESLSPFRFFPAAMLLWFCGTLLEYKEDVRFKVMAAVLITAPTVWGAVVAFYRQRSLKFPIVLLVFCFFAVPVETTMLIFFRENYSIAYWMIDLLSDLIICCMVLEIIVSLFSSRWRSWALPYLGVLVGAATMGILLPSGSSQSQLCTVSVMHEIFTYAAGMLLLSLMLARAHWTKERRMVATGIAVLVLPSFLFHVLFYWFPGWDRNHWLLYSSLYGITYTAGLVLLSTAGAPRQEPNISDLQKT